MRSEIAAAMIAEGVGRGKALDDIEVRTNRSGTNDLRVEDAKYVGDSDENEAEIVFGESADRMVESAAAHAIEHLGLGDAVGGNEWVRVFHEGNAVGEGLAVGKIHARKGNNEDRPSSVEFVFCDHDVEVGAGCRGVDPGRIALNWRFRPVGA